MTATITDPRAWNVAISMGLAMRPRLRWAEWAAGWTSPCTCVPEKKDGIVRHQEECRGPERLQALQRKFGYSLGMDLWCARAIPVPEPWDIEAYKADCARSRSCLVPGTLPSLVYRPGPEEPLWWAVDFSPSDGTIVVHVGHGMPTLWTVWGPGAGTQGDHANLQACFRRADIAVVGAALDLAKVAAKAMRSRTVVRR